MTNRIVIPFLGDTESAVVIAEARATAAEVIAVVLDLRGSVSLNELRLSALAAGATRCHALDVSEEFFRLAVLPTLRAGRFAAASPALGELAARFVNDQLRTIAAIEQATVIERRDPVSIGTGKTPSAVAGPAVLELAFSDGVPVAVNRVPMTLTELMDSVETIAGHSPTEVIRLAYRELGPSGHGDVLMRFENGRCTIDAAATAV